MRPQSFADSFGLGYGDLWDLAPVGAALLQRAGYVHMDVANCLVSRDAIVLPYGNAGAAELKVDRHGYFSHSDHHLGGLCIGQPENGFAMPHRNHKRVRFSARLLRNHDGDVRGPRDDRVVAFPREVCAEGTASIWLRNVDASRPSHDISRESKNA